MRLYSSKLNQLGVVSAHVVLPAVLAIGGIAGVGAYVVSKSGASAVSGVSVSGVAVSSVTAGCGSIYRSGSVYYSVVGTLSKFTSARDSDSVRNIATRLCERGFLAPATARSINTTGNYSPILKTAYSNWQKKLGYTGADADGVPGKTSLLKLGLVPSGF